jgi:hypothetical protein
MACTTTRCWALNKPPSSGRHGSIEFSVSRPADEGMPFAWCESEKGAVGVLAVADADLAVWQACRLDAIAVGEAPGALDPVRAGIRSQTVAWRRSVHVINLAESSDLVRELLAGSPFARASAGRRGVTPAVSALSRQGRRAAGRGRQRWRAGPGLSRAEDAHPRSHCPCALRASRRREPAASASAFATSAVTSESSVVSRSATRAIWQAGPGGSSRAMIGSSGWAIGRRSSPSISRRCPPVMRWI